MDMHDHFAPPVPAPPEADLPWWRLLRALRSNALAMWPRAAYESPVLAQRFLGRTRLLLNDPAAIHRVLVENTANYRRTPATLRILRPLVGEGLLLSEGEAWRHQRRTIAPALGPRAIPLLAGHALAAAREAVAGLAEASGQPVDLLAAMQRLALTIAARSMFSLEMAAHGAALRGLLARYAQRLGRPYLLDMLLPPGVANPHDLARARFRRAWVALMDQIIAERLATPAAGAPRDLFDLLLAARDPETGAAFAPSQLRDQVATLIIAGHETTATTLFWALYLLAASPDAQARMAEELRGVDLTAATLTALPYTRAVVQEALRLYPPAFTLVRQAIGADVAAGVEIPPGTVVLVAPWVLHRHVMLWDRPARFDPGRFLPGAAAIPRLAYLPFGTGPRVCVGSQFALAEAALVLAVLVQAFAVELVGTRPVLPAAVVTTQPDHAPLFRLARRR